MQRFYDVVTDQFGNPANGVLVSVYNASTGLPATIYRDSDNALTATNVISNPFTTNASGIAAFAAANGQYTITYSGSSITPRTFTWLTLNDGSTSSVPWGSITGTLSDQTDLDTALGLKAPSASPTFTTSATFSFLTNTRVPFAGVGGSLTDSANLTYASNQLYIADTTASTNSTTGALRVSGGIGVALASFFGNNLTCAGTLTNNGALTQMGGTALASSVSFNMYSAAGQQRNVGYLSGANLRWQFGTAGEAEGGSDSGTDFSVRAYTDAGSSIDSPLNIIRASGGKITLGTTSRTISTCKTTNGADWIRGSASELLTLSTAGTTTDTTANLLPANAIIEAVVARVTTTITTATSWQLGDPTTAGRFTNANSTMTAGTTDIGLKHQQGSVATDAAGPVQTAAAKVRVTTVGTPGAGAIRITVFYRQFVAPTS